MITRIGVAFEAEGDGFWLARRLRARGIEGYVIYPTSVAVSREHRRAEADRLDTELLKRAFLGWLGGERDHCSMGAISTLAPEPRQRALADLNRMNERHFGLGPASEASSRPCAKRHNSLKDCARQKVRPCRRIRWPNCSATWRVRVSQSARYGRSSAMWTKYCTVGPYDGSKLPWTLVNK